MSPSLQEIRALIIDIDGVLWNGTRTQPGIAEFFQLLRARAIKFVIASNNSARPASDIVARLARENARVTESEILTSAEATARYLPRLVPRGARVFLVGGAGIADALTRAGFQLVEENADVVVAGLDLQFTYAKLARAMREIRNGAKFVGTNADKTFPSEDGLAPGAGAMLDAIKSATDVAPIVIGKPERAMFDLAVEQLQTPREFVAMLGDRLDTDIEGAQRAELNSILVLSGVTTREILSHARVQPDFVFEDIRALTRAWQTPP
ncbi:MAG: HAD-IIA family hydrolase [Chloroflexi bacterium]|nr:HAD-IIA family hydrolase [Chloroflexota bacterium]